MNYGEFFRSIFDMLEQKYGTASAAVVNANLVEGKWPHFYFCLERCTENEAVGGCIWEKKEAEC